MLPAQHGGGVVDVEAEAARNLDLFAAAVQTKVRTPLAPLPSKRAAQDQEVPEPKLPQRSRRQASQALSRVPASRRGDVLMMRCFGVVNDNAVITEDNRKACDDLYRAKLAPKEFAAVRELFPSTRATSTPRGRRRVTAAT